MKENKYANSDCIIVGRFSHAANLQERLKLLSFVILNKV